MDMIPRDAIHSVRQGLQRQAAVALIGPRQVGKTTLAFEIAKEFDALYLDLESYEDRAKLADPAQFLMQFEDRLVILDEVHRMPNIFNELRGLIDLGRRKGMKSGRYLILGSASVDLLKQSGETLAGRIEFVDLNPLSISEVATDSATTTDLWVRGGFPESYLAKSDEDSFIYRRNFIQTYLEREVSQFGFRLPAETLRRLWTMLAHTQGGLLNISKFATNLSMSSTTVRRYVDLLIGLLLVRQLTPYHFNIKKRLVKSPKTYIRDSGLLHTLLGIVDFNQLAGHPVFGVSWEGYVIENILARVPYGTLASFYRTTVGAEIDLLLEIPLEPGLWAIEIKWGLRAKSSKGFRISCDDLNPSRTFIVYSGDDYYTIANNVEVIGIRKFLGILDSYK